VSTDPYAHFGPPDAFGVRAGPDSVFVPRAALVHLTGGFTHTTFAAVDGAMVLYRDTTGLLAALGLRQGDRLLACAGAPVPDIAAVDTCFARLYTATELDLGTERNGTPRPLRAVLDGPPVPAPEAPLVWLEPLLRPPVTRPPLPGPEALAATYGLTRSGSEARMPRGALVRVVDDRVEVRPVRVGGGIVAYDVESPVLAALGWAGATARVDDLPLTSDPAVREAVARLFTASAIVVTPADGGPPLTLHIDGAPTAPPAFWKPRVLVDAPEARIRAGVRLDGDTAYASRAAFYPLLELARADVPRRGRPEPEATGPVVAYPALGLDVVTLLDLPWDAPVAGVDGVAVYGATSVTELRRRLLTEEQVTLALGGASPGRLVIRVEGAPVPLPDDWPTRAGTPELNQLQPNAVSDLVRWDGDTARLDRLAVLWLLRGAPFAGVPKRDGFQLSHNELGWALRVPVWSVLTTVDGAPATGPTALLDLTERLCTAPEVTLTFRRDGETFTRVVRIDGAPVTPP
jgi:hypothetical protein